MSNSEAEAILHLGPFDRHGTTRAPWKERSIEVEHGIPGETVRAEVFGGKRPRGRILQVLEPAPDRVEPPCVYFRDWYCGGCQWQQIAYESQLARKEEYLNSLLAARNLDVRVERVHALREPWRYRSTAGIALGRSAGFRRQASLAIVPLHDCPISHPAIGRLMALLNEAIAAGTLPDFRGRVRIDVRVVESGNDPSLQTAVRPSDERKGWDLAQMRALAETLSRVSLVSGSALIHPTGAVEAVSGPLFSPTQVAGKPVYLTAASFFQTNLVLLPDLISRLLEEAAPGPGRKVADFYGGVGIFGLFMAERGAQVTVVESDRTAVQAGVMTAREWGLQDVRFLTVEAESAMDLLPECDVVIVDPPRSGLTDQFLRALGDHPPPLLLYVSCLPQSLARDLVPLGEAGYTVESVEMFDFYPQTYHVEALAVLRHRG